MNKNKANGYEALFFAYVDLTTNNSVVIGTGGDDFKVLEDAYGVSKGDLGVELKGKISRKNDFIPPVSDFYSK